MVHIFAGDPLDRADRQRRDPGWVEEHLDRADSRFLAFSDLRVLVDAGPPVRLAWHGPEILDHLGGARTPVLLGLLGESAHFGVEVAGGIDPLRGLALPDGIVFDDPRRVATELSLEESGILAHAKSAVDWHARHQFCANCGAATVARRGGKERVCEACESHHFPRTDPVVIMVVAHDDLCLLGRSSRRRSGFYSALAGFVDQGESIEEAVRREIIEEAGVRVGEVRYHSSQPWPFPSSLMIGCIADALTTAIEMDEVELSDVRWFHREEVVAALGEAGTYRDGLSLPGPIAIAHHLIRTWVTEG